MKPSALLISMTALAIALSNCATAPMKPDCDPQRAWTQGLDGNIPESNCSTADQRLWLEAKNLALELRQLIQQRETLTRQSKMANSLQFAKLQREIDQIVGAALIRGWPVPEQVRTHQ